MVDPFGAWLRKHRRNLDLTQEEFARLVPCSTIAIRKIEAGERRPSLQMAERFADLFDISLAQRGNFLKYARGNILVQLPEEITTRPFGSGPGCLATYRLPVPLNRLIGRTDELAELETRLLDERIRLLTLYGAPGVGKTRLGVEVLRHCASEFPHGAVFVELAHVLSPDGIAPAILRALGMQEQACLTPVEQLVRNLRRRRSLIMLDNFEQVLPGAALVVALLSVCEQLKILITSRIALRVPGEWLFPISPLTFPDTERLPALSELAGVPAVELFVERACAAQPDFKLTTQNAASVAGICARLEGIPLAIELIAARIRSLTAQELNLRLDYQMRYHTDGMRAVADRQRTLFNAIQWSLNLLSLAEKALFARLGVFVAGCTLEAVEAVCGEAEESPHQVPPPIVDTLTSLVDQSLVIQKPGAVQRRYGMLAMIREFALRWMAQLDDVNTLRSQHADYYLAFAEKNGHLMVSAQQVEWLDSLEAEMGNLCAALDWALANGEAEIAARLGCAISSVWTIRSGLLEGRRWLEAILACPDLADEWRIRILNEAGTVAYLAGDYITARNRHGTALALAEIRSDKPGIANALFGLGNSAMNEGDYAFAKTLQEQCLPLARECADLWLTAMVLNTCGEMARLQGNLATAAGFFEEGIEIFHRLGDRIFITILLDNLGSVVLQLGEVERAAELHLLCLEYAFQARHQREFALALEKLAGVACALGDGQRGARFLGAASVLRQEIGAPVEALDRRNYEQVRAVLHERLGENGFSNAWEAGRRLTIEQILAEGEAVVCIIEQLE
jgi:predicted ATPase/DNA-binding XRE family transcriptional regulator